MEPNNPVVSLTLNGLNLLKDIVLSRLTIVIRWIIVPARQTKPSAICDELVTMGSFMQDPQVQLHKLRTTPEMMALWVYSSNFSVIRRPT